MILSGGETTVSIRGTGKGGPNTEFALGIFRIEDLVAAEAPVSLYSLLGGKKTILHIFASW